MRSASSSAVIPGCGGTVRSGWTGSMPSRRKMAWKWISPRRWNSATLALGEHFAQGRLTLDELCVRLDATLTATTHGELSRAAQDLPDLTLFLAQVSLPPRKRARPGHNTGKPPGPRPWQHHHG